MTMIAAAVLHADSVEDMVNACRVYISDQETIHEAVGTGAGARVGGGQVGGGQVGGVRVPFTRMTQIPMIPMRPMSGSRDPQDQGDLWGGREVRVAIIVTTLMIALWG